MLDQTRVFSSLEKAGVTFFAGVPDSYLNGFLTALSGKPYPNVVCANEGNAVALAAGRYFATGEIPLVYLQNSGMGNALNPLVSLADRDVYAAPMILLIGWRGEGDTEPYHPQHKRQGAITLPLLDLMGIPYEILKSDDGAFEKTVLAAARFCREERRPFALVAPKGVMAASEKKNVTGGGYPLTREEAVEILLDLCPPDAVFCATTGRASRELFFLREKRGETKKRDYLNVGAMGHNSSVALGIALARPERRVVALDGDGAAIMHLGALTVQALAPAPNFLHVVLNNGVHESVGGVPSAGFAVDLTAIAAAAGYATAPFAATKEDLCAAVPRLLSAGRAAFLEIRIRKGLARPLPPIRFDHRAAIDGLMNELQKKAPDGAERKSE